MDYTVTYFCAWCGAVYEETRKKAVLRKIRCHGCQRWATVLRVSRERDQPPEPLPGAVPGHD